MEFKTVKPILDKLEKVNVLTEKELGQVERGLIMMELYDKVLNETLNIEDNGLDIKYHS